MTLRSILLLDVNHLKRYLISLLLKHFRQRDSDEFAEPAAKQIRSTKRTTQARIESDNNIESNTGQSLLSSLTIKQEPVTPNKVCAGY